MGVLVADIECEPVCIYVPGTIAHAVGLKAQSSTSEPLGFGHVADEDGLGLRSRVVLLVELLKKYVEFFGAFFTEEAEIFVCFGTHAMDEMIESGLLGVGGPC